MRSQTTGLYACFAGIAGLIGAVGLLSSWSWASSPAITVHELSTVERNIDGSADRVQGQTASGENGGLVFEEWPPTGPRKPGQAPPPEAEDPTVAGRRQELPPVAIIIDDMGYHQRIGEALLDLDLNLTFSFLSEGPFTPAQQERAWLEGHDVLVHMPMEAHEPSWEPGPGTLRVADPPAAIARKVERHLAAVPRAVGVNNHMGSLFTESRDAMELFLEQIEERGMIFIDSGTSSRSIAMEIARAMGIPTGRRHVFLDNIDTTEDICGQLQLLVEQAVRHGRAIGIGHPGEATLAALNSCGKELPGRVRLVGIGQLAR